VRIKDVGGPNWEPILHRRDLLQRKAGRRLGRPAAAGANALDTAAAVKKKMSELSRYFPPA